MEDPESWHPVPARAGETLRGAPEFAPVPDRPAPLRVNWFGRHDGLRAGRMSFDPTRARHWVAGIAVGLVLLVLSGNLVVAAWLEATGTGQAPMDAQALWFGLGLNMLLLIGAPLLWVWALYEGGASAWRHRLMLRSYGVMRDVLIGVGVGLLGLLLGLLVVLLTQQFTSVPTDNPLVEDLAARLTWPLVVFIAFASSTSEEVFFRGFLQPRLGVVVTSVLFGFVHLSYGTPLQVVIPLLLGLLLAWAALRTRSLLPAIVAHFTFNFIQLVLAKACFDGLIDCAPM